MSVTVCLQRELVDSRKEGYGRALKCIQAAPQTFHPVSSIIEEKEGEFIYIVRMVVVALTAQLGFYVSRTRIV